MNRQISAIISLKDRFSGPLLKMSDNVSKLDKETKSSMNRVNRWGKQVEKSMDRAVKATMKWAKRGAIVAGGWSLKSGIEGSTELDYAARKVSSIAGDRLNLDDIKQDIKDFSFEFGKAYEEIGDGMYNAISASIPMDLLNEAVELANQLSIAGFTDMDSSIALMASTMNAFDMKSSEEMQNMADQFLLTQNLGVITVDEMSQYYGRISTLSGQIGATLEEQNAAMATMTMRGMTQREATTSYRSILNAFLKDTTDNQAAALDAMGLGSDFLTAKTFKDLGFSGVVEEVARAAKGDLDLVSEIFKDIRGKTGAIMFGPTAGMEDYERILDELQNPEGVLDDAHATLNQSVTRQWEIFKNRIRTLNDELYTEEDGVGGYLVEQLKIANDWLDENRDGIIKDVNDISRNIIEGFKSIADFTTEHGDTILLFLKIVGGMYIFTKVTGWISSFSTALGSLIDVFKAIKGGKIVTSLFGGALGKGILSIGKAVGFILVPVAKFLAMVAIGIVLVKGFLKIYEAVKTAWQEKSLTAGLDVLRDGIGSLTGSWDGLMDKLREKMPGTSGKFDELNEEIEFSIDTQQEFNRLLEDPTIGVAEIYTDKFNEDIRGADEAYSGLLEYTKNNAVVGSAMVQGHIEFRRRIDGMLSSWRNFKRELASPVVANPEVPRGVESLNPFYGAQKSYDAWLGHNYKGTPSWKGGPTWVHERGGEIMDLPGGTRIYPHDESVRMARNEGATLASAGGQVISYNFGDFVFSGDFNTEMDINEVGTKIVNVIKKELNNI